jgi:hypothetical protein
MIMQAVQDFEAYAAGANITDQGGALVTFMTDKGHVAVLMRRVVLERLLEQTKSELQRVSRTGRKR